MADKPQRYIPPGDRNRKGKKSGDNRGSGQQNRDGERGQPQSVPLDAGFQMERFGQKIITLENCANGDAYQLMKERWAAAIREYEDPAVDLSVRPIMYYGGTVWGKLPHQILASTNKIMRPTMSPTDYITEVRKGLLAPRSNN